MSSLVRKATCRNFGILLQPSSRSVDLSNIHEDFGSRYFALVLSTCQPSSVFMSLRRSRTCRSFNFKLKPSYGVWHVGDTCAVNYHVGSENVDPNADTQLELEATPSKPKIQSLEAWPVTRLGGKATPEKVKVPSDADAKQAWTEERWRAARDLEQVKAAKQARDIDAINNHFRMRQEHYKAIGDPFRMRQEHYKAKWQRMINKRPLKKHLPASFKVQRSDQFYQKKARIENYWDGYGYWDEDDY